MLTPMTLSERWRHLTHGLAVDWAQARYSLVVDEPDRARAAALLGPLNPGLSGNAIMFTCVRAGGPSAPDAVGRLLRRLDAEGIEGVLEPIATVVIEELPEEPDIPLGLTAAWDEAVVALPTDWSDLWAEVELTSSDHLDPGALLMAPLNPSRVPERLAFRFRCARRFGYGASPTMARRCFERLDEAGFPGRVSVLRALSDTQPVGTQGPVWYVGGKSV
jgi:hypothetical protein